MIESLCFYKVHQIDYNKLNFLEPTETIDNWDFQQEIILILNKYKKSYLFIKLNK